MVALVEDQLSLLNLPALPAEELAKPIFALPVAEPQVSAVISKFQVGDTATAIDGAAFSKQTVKVVRLGKSLGCDRIFARPVEWPTVPPYPYKPSDLVLVEPDQLDPAAIFAQCWIEWKHWKKGDVWHYTGCMGSPGMKPRFNGVMFPARCADGSKFDPNEHRSEIERFALTEVILNNVPITER